MARWIVWLALEAPDRDTVARRVQIHLAELGLVEKIQSRVSYEIEQADWSALRRSRYRRLEAEEDAL